MPRKSVRLGDVSDSLIYHVKLITYTVIKVKKNNKFGKSIFETL